MEKKNFDPKIVFIVILSLVLILSFLFNTHNSIDYPKDEIKKLKEGNELLSKKNDSIVLVNKNLDIKLTQLDLVIKENNKKLAEISNILIPTTISPEGGNTQKTKHQNP